MRFSHIPLPFLPCHGKRILTSFYRLVANNHYTTSTTFQKTTKSLPIDLEVRDQRNGNTPNQARTALPRVNGTLEELCLAAALDTTSVIGKIMVS